MECPLTASQLQILEMVAEGLTNKEIAARTCRTVSTVRTHLHSAYRRLGVVDRAQAVIVVERHGWITSSLTTPGDEMLARGLEVLERIEKHLPLDREQRARLAAFEQDLEGRRGAINQMLDDLAAVLAFVDQYGTVPHRRRR